MSQPPSGTDLPTSDGAPGSLVPVPDEEKRVRFTMFSSRRKALLSDVVKSARGSFTTKPRRGAS